MTDQNIQNEKEGENFAEDITVESDETLDDSVVAEESLQETVKKLREKLKKAVSEKQEYLDGWQRTKADYLNSKKEEDARRKDVIRFATERLIDDLIPVLQSFDMAFANKEQWEKVDKNWRTGVEYIYSQFKNTLDSNGLKEIHPLGLPFDPNRDEALEYVPVTEESKNHIVVEVVQKGYELNGKLIKAPRVKVGEFKK